MVRLSSVQLITRQRVQLNLTITCQTAANKELQCFCLWEVSVLGRCKKKKEKKGKPCTDTHIKTSAAGRCAQPPPPSPLRMTMT